MSGKARRPYWLRGTATLGLISILLLFRETRNRIDRNINLSKEICVRSSIGDRARRALTGGGVTTFKPHGKEVRSEVHGCSGNNSAVETSLPMPRTGGGHVYWGLYGATKWAIRGISQSLHEEISPLGLRSVCISFGYFRTTFLSGGQRSPTLTRISDYEPIIRETERELQIYDGKQPGDPKKAVHVIVDLVHGQGKFEGKEELPTSLAFGSDAYQIIKESLDTDASNLEKWKEVTHSTDFDA
ncbi:hypothetical protein NMY22_g16781 [Coprinellus aureogranulatus]|nr:hypothetical protein NMY22_g16781 [Coprinellus aureogranulatus]